MRTALYCRVSTEEQARTGESILDQRQALERWAADHGHEVVGVFADEGFSAHKSYKKRPQLQRLLCDLQDGKIDLIAFTKFDRWTRKAADYYELQEILDRFRVPWTAILEDYETMTADGRFKVGIMLSVNQHEAERTSERIKFTFAEKKRRGEIVSGNMPKGYTLKDGKPVKDPKTEAGIAAFWSSYLSGQGMKASILAAGAHGLRLAASSGSFILRNAKHYSGEIQGVSCEPYITPDEAELVLSTRKQAARRTNYPYLFSGIVVCGECGGRMGGHRHFWTHTDGTRGAQIYYNCSYRYRTQPHECGNSVNIYESDLENAVLIGLGDAIEEEASRLEVRIKEQKRKAQSSNAAAVRQKLERRKRRAWEAYLDEIIDKEAYQQEVERIDAELSAIPVPEQIDEEAPTRIRKTMPTGWREIYADLDGEHRQRFWRQMLQRVEVMPDRSVRIVLKPVGDSEFTTRIQQPDGYWIEVVKEKE